MIQQMTIKDQHYLLQLKNFRKKNHFELIHFLRRIETPKSFYQIYQAGHHKDIFSEIQFSFGLSLAEVIEYEEENILQIGYRDLKKDIKNLEIGNSAHILFFIPYEANSYKNGYFEQEMSLVLQNEYNEMSVKGKFFLEEVRGIFYTIQNMISKKMNRIFIQHQSEIENKYKSSFDAMACDLDKLKDDMSFWMRIFIFVKERREFFVHHHKDLFVDYRLYCFSDLLLDEQEERKVFQLIENFYFLL